MADDNKNSGNNIEDAKKRIKELDAEIKRLGGEGFKNIDQFVQSLGNNLENATRQVKLMEGEVDDLRNTFSNIADTLKNIVADINGSVKTSTLLTRNFNKLEDLSRKIQNHKEDENVLTVKELKEIEKKVAAEKKALDANLKQAQIDKENWKRKIESGKLTAKQEKAAVEEIKKLSEYETEILEAQKDKESYYNTIVEKTTAARIEEERIQKSLGVTGQLFKGITGTLEKIGIQSKFFEDINKDLRDAAKEAGSNQWKVLGAGLKSIGAGLGAALKDPLVQITLVIKLLKGLYNLGTAYNKEVAETGKQYALNAQGAKAMVSYQQMLTANSHDEYATRKEVAKAMSEINDSMGTTAFLSQDIVEGQLSLTELYGLQADEANNITKFALLNNTTQEDIVKSVSSQNKGLLNSKKVLQEVAKTEGQLSAFYKNDPKLIGAAVIQAQKLGLTLEKTKGISDALLDIESSLQNEYEAEALIGKDINLNQARYLAMQGDAAGAAAEVLKNIKGSAEFTNMNRIQQDALAKSLGMSADELANSLVSQERLNKLDKEQKKVYNEIKKTRGEAAAQQALQALQEGKSLERSKAALDTQKQMDAAIERMKESLAAVVAGPIGGFVKGLAIGVEKVSWLIGKLAGIFGMGKGEGVGKALGMIVGGAGLIVGLVATVGFIKGVIQNYVLRKTKHDGSSPFQALYTQDISGGASGVGTSTSTSSYGKNKKGKQRRVPRKTPGIKPTKFPKGKLGWLAKGFQGLKGLAPTALSFLGGGFPMPMGGMEGGGGGGGEMGTTSSGSDLTTQATPQRKAQYRDPVTGQFAKKPTPKKRGLFRRLWGGIKSAGKWAWGGIKKLGKGALNLAAKPVKAALKGLSKFLGPIMVAIGGIGNIASIVSDAKARKAAGEKVDTAILGKDIIKSAAYPIANLSLNLIPAVGPAISLVDALLGTFGLSPIKWLTDNLIDWLPDNIFKGLGDFALGEKKAMAAGGIVTGPTNALVGEAGAEAVIPLREFYAKIDELISAVKQGGNIYLDGVAVSTRLQTPMAIATRRTG